MSRRCDLHHDATSGELTGERQARRSAGQWPQPRNALGCKASPQLVEELGGQLSTPISRRKVWVCAMRPVKVDGSPVHSSKAVRVMSSMSSVSVLARSRVPAPGVATGLVGAAALTAIPSSYSSAARLFRHPIHRGLDRAVDPEPGGAVELRERRPGRQVTADRGEVEHPSAAAFTHGGGWRAASDAAVRPHASRASDASAAPGSRPADAGKSPPRC